MQLHALCGRRRLVTLVAPWLRAAPLQKLPGIMTYLEPLKDLKFNPSHHAAPTVRTTGNRVCVCDLTCVCDRVCDRDVPPDFSGPMWFTRAQCVLSWACTPVKAHGGGGGRGAGAPPWPFEVCTAQASCAACFA